MDNFTSVYRDDHEKIEGGFNLASTPFPSSSVPRNPIGRMPNPSAILAAFAAQPFSGSSPAPPPPSQGEDSNQFRGGADTLLHGIYVQLIAQHQKAEQQWKVIAALIGGVGVILILYLERLHTKLHSLELTLASSRN